MTKHVRPIVRLLLKDICEKNQTKSATKFMKIDFSIVIPFMGQLNGIRFGILTRRRWFDVFGWNYRCSVESIACSG